MLAVLKKTFLNIKKRKVIMKPQHTQEKKHYKKPYKPSDRHHNKQPEKHLDTGKVCRFLTKAFASAIEKYGRNCEKGTELYKLQVDFAYYLDEIARGPIFHAPKVIADCNAFIDNINTAKS